MHAVCDVAAMHDDTNDMIKRAAAGVQHLHDGRVGGTSPVGTVVSALHGPVDLLDDPVAPLDDPLPEPEPELAEPLDDPPVGGPDEPSTTQAPRSAGKTRPAAPTEARKERSILKA